MLKDVIFLTKTVFDQALIKKQNLYNPKNVYDTFRNLQDVVSDVNLVAVHYLALDFTESFLQNSSFGEPCDKWRYFLNKDLEKLNISLKEYLHKLSHITHDDFGFETYVFNIYKGKRFYGFIRDNYKIGFIEPKSYSLEFCCLKTNLDTNDSYYISENKKIDLSTFEDRVNLKNELLNISSELKEELNKLKNYIKARYSLDELLD